MPSVRKTLRSINSHTEDVSKVLIIGAGVTGLALAQGLKQAGIQCVVYEQNDQLETKRNWTFNLHWGIEPLQKLVSRDLLDELGDAQVDPWLKPDASVWSVPMLNGQTGQQIKVIESTKCYRLRRDKLVRLLSKGIDVRYGKELNKIELTGGYKTIAARFTDGTQITGRLLIGCDGTHSRVRNHIVGEEQARLESLGFATAMCYTKHTAEHALWLRSAPHHPLQQVCVHPDGHVAFLTMHDAEDKDPEKWTFFHYIDYKKPVGHDKFDRKQLIGLQKDLARNFCEPWKSLYNWIPDDHDHIWATELKHWDPSLPHHSWDNQRGRVTLAGDAAHPMSFQRGQGLNNSIQDAYTLCTAIKQCWSSQEFRNGGDIVIRQTAIEAYEKEMKERGGREVRLSASTSVDLHDFEKITGSGLVKQGLSPVGSEGV